jgi:hypothetical protein
LVVFLLHTYVIQSVECTTFSFVSKTPQQQKCMTPTKNHRCFSSVSFTPKPSLSNHIKKKAQWHGFDVSSHPTLGASAEGADQGQSGWVLTNNADQLRKTIY